MPAVVETIIGFLVLSPGKRFSRDFSVLCAPASWCCTRFSVAQGASWNGNDCRTVLSPSGRRRVRKALPGSLLCYLWLQRILRSRLIFCVMRHGAGSTGAASRRRPCTPGIRPAKSPLRGAFDLSLLASGRAESASVQNTALSPHPCGLPRPSGNVSAILRPPAPAVSATMVNKLTTSRTDRRPGKSQPPPGTKAAPHPLPCPAALRLRGPAKGAN